MCERILCCVIIVVKIMCCFGLGLFHENTKITFQPDDVADYFGYTVLLNDTRLYVGAPKARSRLNRAVSPGLVFSCPVDNMNRKNVTCKPFGPDAGRPGFIAPLESLKDMWFGAVIAAIPTGKLLICAPRWITPYKDTHYLANGACFIQGQKRGQLLLPLQDMHRQSYMVDGKRKEYGEYGLHLNFYAYGQVGMSAKVTEGNTIIIGAPGLLQWTGGISEYMFYPDFKAMTVSFGLRSTTNPYNTKVLGPDDYLGYSVESGVFDSTGKTLYVAGAPRSSGGYGQVLIFEQSFKERDALNIKALVRGPHLGSYFGGSVACADINGDGVVDLLVGAPTYVNKGGVLSYDQGAVFVYFTERQNTSFVLKTVGHVTGSGESGARFGTAVAELGDVDGDGFTDIAIGAPWEKDGTGAVYIYRGGSTGLKSPYVQRVFAEGARSFGISISKGVDIDNNNCNDLAVGAFQTGAAYMYRCVPTMQVFSVIKVPDAMDLPQNATNFTAIFCINTPARKMWPFVKIDLRTKITVDLEENRARISGDSEYVVSVKPGIDVCEEQTIEVMPTADMTKPISIQFSLTPKELMKDDSPVFLMNAARLSEDSVLHSSFDIQLARDCGEDLICKPLLFMTLAPLVQPYVPGSDDKLGFNVTILNKEEPAYGVKVYLTLPLNPMRLPSDCSLEGLNVTCSVPSPLYRGKSIVWDIEMEYTSTGVYNGTVEVFAKLEDPFHKDQNKTKDTELRISVTPESTFKIIEAKALPNKTISVPRDKFYEGDSVDFVHQYEITNLGPSDAEIFNVNFSLQQPHPYKVILSNVIKDCYVSSDIEPLVTCSRSLSAKDSISIILQLRFDLSKYKDILEANTSLILTSKIIISDENNDLDNTRIVSTTLVLDPAPPIWPHIVGVMAGLALLAAIVFAMYKYGFFSRISRDELKRLQEQSLLLEDSCASIADDVAGDTADEPTRELVDDSD